MGAFRPSRVSPAQLDTLVSDPELLAASGTIRADIATRASQASVDGIVSTMGPAITAGTADKATQASLNTLTAQELATRSLLVAALQNVSSAVTNSAAPKATSAEVFNVAASLAANQDTAKADTLAAIASAAAPLATAVQVAAVQYDVSQTLGRQQLQSTTAQDSAYHAQTVLLINAEVSAAQAAIVANDNAIKSALLLAIAQGGVRSGEARTFLANAVPADFTKTNGTDYIPTGGVVEVSAASSTGLASGDSVYVSSGANPGLWRYRKDRFQRFDIATNAPVGSEYLCPTTMSASVGPVPALEVIGTKIYYAGIASGAGSTATAKFYVFDTNTLTNAALADFPRALVGTGAMRSALLGDGRILFTATQATGLTVTPAAMPFWIYDPVSMATPTEVIVSLPITKFNGSTVDLLMQPLTNGQLLLVDSAAPVSGNALSCCLTISGNAITTSAAEDTGFALITGTSTGWFLATATGALLGSAGVVKSYVSGGGWSPATAPNAYGSLAYGLRSKRVPGLGWLLIASPVVGGGCLYTNLYLTASPLAGAVSVQAIKN